MSNSATLTIHFRVEYDALSRGDIFFPQQNSYRGTILNLSQITNYPFHGEKKMIYDQSHHVLNRNE